MRFRNRRRYQPAIPFFVGFIFVIIGLPFCGVSAFIGYDSQNFLRGTVSTQGVIVACTETDSQDDSSGCKPTIRFRTTTGTTQTFTASFSSSSYQVDQTIPVNYHPEHPADARISDFIALWLLPLIFGGVGLFLAMLGLLFIIVPLFFFLLRRRRASGQG